MSTVERYVVILYSGRLVHAKTMVALRFQNYSGMGRESAKGYEGKSGLVTDSNVRLRGRWTGYRMTSIRACNRECFKTLEKFFSVYTQQIEAILRLKHLCNCDRTPPLAGFCMIISYVKSWWEALPNRGLCATSLVNQTCSGVLKEGEVMLVDFERATSIKMSKLLRACHQIQEETSPVRRTEVQRMGISSTRS